MEQIETILRNQREELLRTNPQKLVSRKEENEFDLDSELAQIVIGVRRSGKSTLCQKVLIQSGIKFAYVNFDDEYLSDLPASQLNSVVEALYVVYGDFTHLFIDEIQNAAKWPMFVNRLMRQGIRLVLTGSNANLLSH